MKLIAMQCTYVLEINGKRFLFNTNKTSDDNLLFNYFHSDKCRDTKMQYLEILVFFMRSICFHTFLLWRKAAIVLSQMIKTLSAIHYIVQTT